LTAAGCSSSGAGASTTSGAGGGGAGIAIAAGIIGGGGAASVHAAIAPSTTSLVMRSASARKVPRPRAIDPRGGFPAATSSCGDRPPPARRRLTGDKRCSAA
jgi:hypothetical protein